MAKPSITFRSPRTTRVNYCLQHQAERRSYEQEPQRRSVEVFASFRVSSPSRQRPALGDDISLDDNVSLTLTMDSNKEKEETKDEREPHTQCFVRSRSQDRLWNEAARFYEAVGAHDLVHQQGVQQIIEDDSSCSDEEESGKRHGSNKPQEPPERLSLCPSYNRPESATVLLEESASRRYRNSFSHLLPSQTGSNEAFFYRGISANPPDITKRGMARGNAAQIHRKAWLEVSDTKHRYGKNLRLYYRHWEGLGYPTNNFFDWLDCTGDATGKPLPSLDGCLREELDSDTVLYITDPEITSRYALELLADSDGRCRVLDAEGKPVHTGPDGWIFVLRGGIFYGALKVNSAGGTKQRFHHSSFLEAKL